MSGFESAGYAGSDFVKGLREGTAAKDVEDGEAGDR